MFQKYYTERFIKLVFYRVTEFKVIGIKHIQIILNLLQIDSKLFLSWHLYLTYY